MSTDNLRANPSVIPSQERESETRISWASARAGLLCASSNKQASDCHHGLRDSPVRCLTCTINAAAERIESLERALSAAEAKVGEMERLRGLLVEARATLEMWKDVAPAVSLCRDIDAALLPKGPTP